MGLWTPTQPLPTLPADTKPRAYSWTFDGPEVGVTHPLNAVIGLFGNGAWNAANADRIDIPPGYTLEILDASISSSVAMVGPVVMLASVSNVLAPLAGLTIDSLAVARSEATGVVTLAPGESIDLSMAGVAGAVTTRGRLTVTMLARRADYRA